MDKLNQIRKTNKEYRLETIRILKLEKQIFLDKIKHIENWIVLNEELIKNSF